MDAVNRYPMALTYGWCLRLSRFVAQRCTLVVVFRDSVCLRRSPISGQSDVHPQ